MSSLRKIESSRANGAKSRGPKTAAGKLRSAANGRRHGLLSRTLVLENENAESFAALLEAFARDIEPRNEIERSLVENMAVGRWRLLRLWAVERATIAAEMAKHDATVHEPAAIVGLAFRALSDQSRCLDLLHRYEIRFDRQFARSLTLLLMLASGPARDSVDPEADIPVRFPQNNLGHSNPIPFSDTPPATPHPPTD